MQIGKKNLEIYIEITNLAKDWIKQKNVLEKVVSQYWTEIETRALWSND